MTVFACPHCGTRMGIPAGSPADQKFRCPQCRKTISLSARAPQRKADAPAALPPDWIALDQTEDASETETLIDTPETVEQEAFPPFGAIRATEPVAPLIAARKRRSKSGRWLIPGGLFAGVAVVAAVSVWDHYANR